MHDRFFDSTRGKIVEALRGRPAASAYDLAQEFGLSPNAIRQQLVILERDGLVASRSARRGKTKPTQEYSLTGLADRYFPQAYDRILNAVLREIRAEEGDAGVARIFAKIGERAAKRVGERVAGQPLDVRIAEVANSVKANGVTAEVERQADRLVLHEHNCPYASVVSENPEACAVIHTMLGAVVSPEVKQTESLATGGRECRFEVPVG